jgi:ABC-type uncharacterized transport system permease subunit
MAILIHVLAAALYGAAAWARWPAAGGSPTATGVARAILPVALGVHAAALLPAIVTPEGLDVSLPNAASLVAGLVVLVAWASGFLRSLPGSAAIVLSAAGVAALLPAFFREPHHISFAGDTWAALHIAVALTAYAILLVAALAALLMTGLEKRLHKGLPAAGDGTPPLLTLERYLFRLIAAGFVLLSLTLASGALFSEQVFGRPFKLTHKSLFSLLAWLTFGGLLVGRWRFGWRGRRARVWILAGAGLLVLAYLGSKFVLEVLLQR